MEAARSAWVRQLIDLSRRNPLLFFRDLKVGTLDLTAAEVKTKAALLRGNPVEVRRFFPGAEEARACAVALEVHRRALWNLEERGLDTMFLALGFATWPAGDGGRPHEVPLLLVPITAEMRAQDPSRIVVRRFGDLQINPVLAFAMESEHGIRLDVDALVAAVQGDEDGEAFDLQPLLNKVQADCGAIREFALHDRAVLGNFAFQKMAMVQDLKQGGEALAAHDLVAALAGDGEAQRAVIGAHRPVAPQWLDDVPAASEFLILDADSSQQAVIAQVVAGQHGVIQGPPGANDGHGVVPVPSAVAEVPPARGPRPGVVPGRAITEYAMADLDAIVRWVRSDGRLRTDEQLLDEVIADLAFSRRGARIVEAIRGAIRRTKP